MMIRLFLATTLLLATPAAASVDKIAEPLEPSPQLGTSFDGVWQGVIKFDKEAFLADTSTPDNGATFRIEIRDVLVRVFVQSSGEYRESKPGRFHIASVSANAVIFATDEDPGAWVETWAFVITKKDENTLIVEYSRLVNNVSTSLNEKESKFATRGAGEFKRVAKSADH